LKEKEALDVGLAAVTKTNESSDPKTSDQNSQEEVSKQLQTVMTSLATLSSEKSRMEVTFQAEKKNLRQEIVSKSNEIKDLNERLAKLILERENLKSKCISYERMLTDERHLKENLETQLSQLKTQFSQTSNSDKFLKDLNMELAETKKKLRAFESYNSKFKDDSTVLQSLRSEIDTLKKQHIANLTAEKQRASEANERSQKLIAIHEEQVQSLESRLSELSSSIAQYHMLRESDQKYIVDLKDKLMQSSTTSEVSQQIPKQFPNVNSIINEIERLKHLLIYENTKLAEPMDLSEVFSSYNYDSGVSPSEEKYSLLKEEFEKLRSENEMNKLLIKDQSEHIKTLKEKIQVLNNNIESLEIEISQKSKESNNELKTEKIKWRENMNLLEGEYRSKISQLEQQLQKQRERSLTMLEEKENEMRALKTSFDVFLPKKSTSDEDDDGQHSQSSNRRSSHHLGMVLNQSANSSSNIPETHLIYYSNELARKDLELASIRKAKREADNLIRETLKQKIMIQETLDEKIAILEQQVERLDRSKSREGANLEYLKNVVVSFLETDDQEKKSKMLNAIAAVLKFDENEIKQISKVKNSKKK
jgi:GRIP and coiled-coil domain-containing protein 1